MSEAVSALPDAGFTGRVTVADAGLHGMVTVRGDLGSAKMKKAVKSIAGVDVPDVRGASFEGEIGVLWMSPDELLVLVPYTNATAATEKLAKALKGTHHLVVNVSDARAVIRLSGPEWREVLARLTPADLHPDAFGPGELRRTRLAQTAAAFWVSGDEEVTVVCFRSVAKYVFDLLSNAADAPAPVDHF
jgi:sarcosine oxidase subunit gamma